MRKYAQMIGISNTSVSRAVQEGILTKSLVEVAGKKFIMPEIANEEWGKTFLDEPTDDGPASNQDAADNRALYEKFRAEKMRLQVLRMSGELVDKQEVYRALYGFGAELRAELMTIPDRFIDEIISATSRHQAHKILYDALESCLLTMSDIESREISKNVSIDDDEEDES